MPVEEKGVQVTWWGCLFAKIEQGLAVCSLRCQVRSGVGVSIGFVATLLLREKRNWNRAFCGVEMDLCVTKPGSHIELRGKMKERKRSLRIERDGKTRNV